MTDTIIIILISLAIALFLGIFIVLINMLLSDEKKKPEKVQRILDIAPKRDCGACGYAGCEAYARVLAKDPKVALRDRCPFMTRDPQKLSELEKILGIKVGSAKKK